MIVHGWIVKVGWVLVKEIVGVLGLFEGVFRYRFSRLDSEYNWFNFFPRR